MIKPILLESILLLGILVVFFMDLFLPKSKKIVSGIFTLILLLLLILISIIMDTKGLIFSKSFVNDSFSITLKQIFIIATAIATLGSINHAERFLKGREGEYFLLLLFSLVGMMVVVSSRELLLLFVGFELMSIPLYVLSGFSKENPRSAEGAIKIFLFGTVSSALLLLGIGIFFAVAGTTSWSPFLQLKGLTDPLGTLALIILFSGFGFKIAAFPFQFWVPDTYEGSPTPFVAFLSVAPKIAGFGILFRFFFEALDPLYINWTLYAFWIAALTMIIGNLLALPQKNIKRLLAYSGIAHIGYILLGLASGSQLGLEMSVFYFVAYLFSNMGAFLVAEVVSRSNGTDELDSFKNLSSRSPLLSLAMLIFLLSLGGIPFVVGFWAKLYIFLAAAKSGYFSLVFLGALMTVVALFYYLNIARRMYIDEKAEEIKPLSLPLSLSVSISVCALLVILLGFYPNGIVSFSQKAISTFVESGVLHQDTIHQALSSIGM
ncbi:MAG: NADH-quinone oxidoreductase subunit N [Thermodesulfobacteriota bacterium]